MDQRRFAGEPARVLCRRQTPPLVRHLRVTFRTVPTRQLRAGGGIRQSLAAVPSLAVNLPQNRERHATSRVRSPRDLDH